MNNRHSLLLTSILSSAVLLSACGADENLQLGTRDDIVIMKNGVPVDGAMVADAVTETPSGMTVDTAPSVPASTEIVQEEIQEIAAPVMDDVEGLSEEKAIESVTELTMTEPTTPEVLDAETEITETVTAQAEKIEMKAAKSVNTELMTNKVAEIAETASDSVTSMAATSMKSDVVKPMATTPMKSEAVEELEEAVTETPVDAPAATEAVSPAKVEGGCYKNMLVATTNAVPVMEERRIVCNKDLNPSLIAIVQQSLINRDYAIGAPDGKMGNKTLNALEAFQRKNGLAVGSVTFETLDKLNITL